MSEISEQRLKELIKNHEENFQKHLLALDMTGNLFKECLKYIEKLEAEVFEYRRKKPSGDPRCLAWSKEEGQCKNLASRMLRFDGDPNIYFKEEITKSVIVGFCQKHMQKLKINGIDVSLETYSK